MKMKIMIMVVWTRDPTKEEEHTEKQGERCRRTTK
jgi:hypothetical protein